MYLVSALGTKSRYRGLQLFRAIRILNIPDESVLKPNVISLGAPLKMHFSRDSGVSTVLESSFTPRKLRLSGRCFLALTKKSLFLEVPLGELKRWAVFFRDPHAPGALAERPWIGSSES